jgi:hypothetical protein
MKTMVDLPKIESQGDLLPINGKHGLCRAYYQPDELDLKTIAYANALVQQPQKKLHALDLGCSPYCPQSQRLATLGFQVDAFDLEKPMKTFKEINQQYFNRIHYRIKNLTDLKAADLCHNYQIVYSNRCLSFLPYRETYALLRLLVNHVKANTRFFLGFFAEGASYAEGYPIELPLENRYLPLPHNTAKQNEMLAPVCVYKQEELYQNLLDGLPIRMIEELRAKSGSLKIIFETVAK